MKRKTIGLFIGSDDNMQEGLVCNEILRTAREQDINVICLHSMAIRPSYIEAPLTDEVVEGEGNIFFLKPLREYDGIIIIGELLRHDFTKRIIDEAKACGVPLININNNLDNCYQIVYDDSIGMKEMVLHLIREHGCRKINCVSGFEGNKESEERIAAYKEALEECGIPFEPERISYGYFYNHSAEVVAEYLKDHELPDAFACANDTMAMFVITYLSEQGYKVPEDVIVTGFDNTQEGMEFEPTVTSVVRSVERSGTVAMELLERLWKGEEVPQCTSIPAHLWFGQSCGCAAAEREHLVTINHKKTQELTQKDTFIHYLSEIWTKATVAQSMPELMSIICPYIFFFDQRDADFYMNADIFDRPVREEDYVRGFSKDQVKVHYNGDTNISLSDVFNPAIFPELSLQGEGSVQREFIPMYISGRTIGFISLPIKKCLPYQSMFYAYLTTSTSAINNLCLIQEKDSLVDKLDSMYVRDELTKLYNRFGMERYGNRILEVAIRDQMPMMCIALDLDGLKYINDSFGHSAGDNAILTVANAMRQASERREICVRSGGDEFLVFGIMEQKSDAKDYIKRLESYLADINQRNNWPYRVVASCGFSVKQPSDLTDLEDLVKSADEMLYRIKEQHRSSAGYKK